MMHLSQTTEGQRMGILLKPYFRSAVKTHDITIANEEHACVGYTYRRRTATAGKFSQSQRSVPEPTDQDAGSWRT